MIGLKRVATPWHIYGWAGASSACGVPPGGTLAPGWCLRPAAKLPVLDTTEQSSSGHELTTTQQPKKKRQRPST